MKKLIIASTLAFALSAMYPAQASTPVAQSADKKGTTKLSEGLQHSTRTELIGFGSGALAGTIAGGPIGGVIGGILGIFMANDINQDEEIASKNGTLSHLNNQLSRQEQAFTSLQQQYAALEQSQMIQLASIDTKVATEWLQDLPKLESNVQFKTASFLVEDAFKSQLKSLAGLLNQYPKLSVHLSGFADARGDSKYNRILSEQRAQAVKDFLIQQRVKPQQIIAQGQGELAFKNVEQPITSKIEASTNHFEALFFDRRVTLKLLNEQNAMTAANQ